MVVGVVEVVVDVVIIGGAYALRWQLADPVEVVEVVVCCSLCVVKEGAVVSLWSQVEVATTGVDAGGDGDGGRLASPWAGPCVGGGGGVGGLGVVVPGPMLAAFP